MGVINALVTTICLLFFLLPGIVFLKGVWGSEKGTLSPSNFYNYLMWGTFASTVIYIIVFLLFNICCWVLNTLFCFENHSIFLENIILNKRSDGDLKALIADIYKLLFIIVVSISSSFFLGANFYRLIIKNKLDLRFDFLRFRNEWFYILNGRDYDFPNGLYTEVFLLCEVGKSVVIYKGILQDYKLKDETLEYITLQGVYRTGISEWENQMSPERKSKISKTIIPKKIKSEFEILNHININPPFYPVEGSILFNASEIKNINVNYHPHPLFDVKKPE